MLIFHRRWIGFVRTAEVEVSTEYTGRRLAELLLIQVYIVWMGDPKHIDIKTCLRAGNSLSGTLWQAWVYGCQFHNVGWIFISLTQTALNKNCGRKRELEHDHPSRSMNNPIYVSRCSTHHFLYLTTRDYLDCISFTAFNDEQYAYVPPLPPSSCPNTHVNGDSEWKHYVNPVINKSDPKGKLTSVENSVDHELRDNSRDLDQEIVFVKFVSFSPLTWSFIHVHSSAWTISSINAWTPLNL